jgi:hypothetical protein
LDKVFSNGGFNLPPVASIRMGRSLSSLSIQRPLLISNLLLGSGPRLGLRVICGEEKQREYEKLREELGSKASHVSSSMDQALFSFSKKYRRNYRLEAAAVYKGRGS